MLKPLFCIASKNSLKISKKFVHLETKNRKQEINFIFGYFKEKFSVTITRESRQGYDALTQGIYSAENWTLKLKIWKVSY